MRFREGSWRQEIALVLTGLGAEEKARKKDIMVYTTMKAVSDGEKVSSQLYFQYLLVGPLALLLLEL